MERESDEALIIRLREGEDNLIEVIMDRYKDLVRGKAASMFILGGDREDLIQEGMIGLFKAIRDYDSGRDASFSTFANLCISRQMYTAVEASARKKHAPLNTYVSLYGSGGDEAAMEIEKLEAPQGDDPEARFLEMESESELSAHIREKLSPLENRIFDLSLIGMSSADAAKLLGIGDKSADNALQRAKSKIRKLLAVKV